MESTTFLKINPADSVVVCLSAKQKGDIIEVDGQRITINQDTPAGHKILIKDVAEGEDIIKYGYPIGHAQQALKAGDWVNEHNLKTNLSGTLEYTYQPLDIQLNIAHEGRTFLGYKRQNGDVGIRNEIWIVPTVGCVNGIAEKLAEKLRQEINCQRIDAIYAWHHNYGCSQLSDDHENTRKILRDICLHPNAGAVLVLSLGCENNQPDDFMTMLGDYDKSRIRLLVTQKVEGDEIEEGMRILRELYDIASKDQREEVPVSELRVGLKCGGSDGLSGITANPLVGRFSDYIVSVGGTTVLTEVPEMFGAEQLLMNRARNEEVFDKTVKLINDFKEYYQKHDQPVYENPSPGNKAGGITTLEDKSLGCTQKSGAGEVCDVLFDGDNLTVQGLNLLNGPGNDMVAVTNLGCAGCHLVLFTTGRGTPFGGFVPTIKISTNSELAKKKSNWIDFNAGDIAEGVSFDDKLSDLTDLIVETVNGRQTVNERYDSRDIALFKTGVTL